MTTAKDKKDKKTQADKIRLIKQRVFLQEYARNWGNITDAVKVAGVDRKTYYNWMSKYPTFKRAVEEIDPSEQSIEFLESMAYQKIRSGSEKLLIFALKAKAGWNEYGSTPPSHSEIKVTIGKAD